MKKNNRSALLQMTQHFAEKGEKDTDKQHTMYFSWVTIFHLKMHKSETLIDIKISHHKVT